MTDLLMPHGAYAQARADEFEMLARHAGCDGRGGTLALRSALSNVFVAMAARRGAR